MLRPLSPNTEAQYRKALGRGISGSESSRRLLRAALRRQALELGEDPERAIAGVPPPSYQIRRIREFLSEEDAVKYEAAARELEPGKRALTLLPLALGLRASTALDLDRKDVERATGTGKLKVLLKRGKEALLAANGTQELLSELLSVPAAPGRQSIAEQRKRPRQWLKVGEILSPKAHITQYHILHGLVRAVGQRAGIGEISPHDLRHAFASRMLRDGATVADIQYALGHESPQTTMIYLHADPGRMSQFMRQF